MQIIVTQVTANLKDSKTNTVFKELHRWFLVGKIYVSVLKNSRTKSLDLGPDVQKVWTHKTCAYVRFDAYGQMHFFFHRENVWFSSSSLKLVHFCTFRVHWTLTGFVGKRFLKRFQLDFDKQLDPVIGASGLSQL